MAFRFVLGRAGSGKTEFCLRDIKRKLIEAPNGRRLIWLVPEQATFQAEYALISAPELGGTLRAQVLSFRRLAWRVMQEVGGTARLPIDETGKKLLLHRILHKHKDRLRRFQASTDQTGFLDNLNQLFSELKRYCITGEGLRQWYETRARSGGQGETGAALEDKIHDLQFVYSEFEAELSRLYLDGEDYLTLLAQQLQQSTYVRGAECWVDGFHGFTPQEFAVLEQLALYSDNVTLTLCLNKDYITQERPHELDLFHPTARTLIQLRERLPQAGVHINETVMLNGDPPVRFEHNPMLAYLERHFEDRIKRPYKPAVPTIGKSPVRISAAVNRRAEVEGAARDIVSLVRDEGLRWRDISVSVRNIEAYGDLVAGTFKDYGIPHFFDQKRSVMHHPLVELIRSSLEAIRNGWKYDAVFRCVKTDFFLPIGSGDADEQEAVRIDRHLMDQLENYVLAFGIQASKWIDSRDWTYSYRTTLDEAGDGPNAADEKFLNAMNACRRRIAEPLGQLQQRMRKRANVRDRVEALYELLVGLHVPERLEMWSQGALREGKPEKAREHSQVWDRVMDMLDQLVELMGEEPTSLELFTELVETGMESIKLGLVPPTLDQVLIGSMDRTRSGQVKHMFVLGVNEGVMPAKITESGVLTEMEREQLASAGLSMAEGSRRRLLDEPFLIYCAFCTPSGGLWLSYPLADEEGKSLLPSDVLRQMKRMFPQISERLLMTDPAPGTPLSEQMEYAVSPDKALSHLIVQLKLWMQGKPVGSVWWSVYNWFARQPEYGAKLSRLLQSLLYTNQEAYLSAETSRLLYGDRIETSVSRMERFVSCPFSQFASHGLRLKERRIFRLDAPDVGQLFHSALSLFAEQTMKEGVDWGALTPGECERRAAIVVDMLAPRLQGEILLSSKRYLYIARKLKQVISRAAVMLGEHAKRGQFRPVGLEIGFGSGESIPPMQYPLANGVQMELRGRIDRIDRADTEQGTLLRVVDYKSSGKALQMFEVYYGLSLQMLAYLDVILTHSPIWLGKEAKPAGVLYFHVHNPVLNAKNGLSSDAVQAELLKKFKTKGMLTADPEIIRLMDSGLIGSSGYSDLLPAALKTDGSFYKTSSVATEQQWDTVRRYVKRTIKNIGESMTDGCIDITPYRSGAMTACGQCAYRSVCHFDLQFEGNAYKTLAPMGKELVWELMEQSNVSESSKGLRSGERTLGSTKDASRPFRPAAAKPLSIAEMEIAASQQDEEREMMKERSVDDGGETP
ncbi:helicase-exonuclease AddAB subunit AddB [Paenibacillus allorhizosphaerae]|uniref:ATP-dependent helicase/deoxyribonuclease subunit B n=1 Tax=Paenibacillus allorhizosphaerae TaxID=2849866 RepID=A0ABN7TKY8_9BACL|nr:helicase-exonuclease AddAB subunit AddB [Paenibacillus allorhizosphaerae]CAG7634498.1 ATP-dependent helicase/deoxyribonuclease subunit B [Paenibacillus allorhizosphaerae]